jgi:hypothetical protein
VFLSCTPGIWCGAEHIQRPVNHLRVAWQRRTGAEWPHLTGSVSSGFAPGTSPTADANNALNRVKLTLEFQVSSVGLLNFDNPTSPQRPPPQQMCER